MTIPISNIYNVLAEGLTTAENTLGETTSKFTEPKLPPIPIEAQIIESLINLLEETANNYTLNNNHVKVQANTTEIHSKIVLALKSKNVNFYIY